jgi:hypothetical protein
MKIKIEFINGSCPMYNSMLAEQKQFLVVETVADEDCNLLYKVYENPLATSSEELEAYLIANNPQSGFVFTPIQD